MTKEMKRPISNITQDSIKPLLSNAVEFYTNKNREAHKCIQERDEYINYLESKLSNAKPQQALPVVPECVAEFVSGDENEFSKADRIAYLLQSVQGDSYYLTKELPGDGMITVDEGQELYNWAICQHHETILKLWNGYTVEKQLFYIALPKVYGLSDSTVIKVCDWVANLKENKKMTVKEKFLNDIKSLIENKEIPKEDKVLTVWIETPEMTARELIVNPFENLQAKHDYYDKAYDDNLNLKANPDIFISTYSTDGQIFSLVEVVE